jgi:hypothetical protein
MNRKKNAMFVLIMLLISISLITVVNAASVEPVFYADWQSGNAAFECSQINSGGNFAYKIDGWGSSGMDGSYAGGIITISSSDGKTFDWESEEPVLAVIVKGGPGANVYFYEGGATSDTGLVAPLNTNTPAEDDTFDISHVTFCIKKDDFVVPEVPLGTISAVLTMLGAAALLRGKTLFIK